MVAQKIERQTLIAAPVDVVWEVVTQPEHISRWFSDSVELDLRPGGELVLHWHASDNRVRGRVERVEPPRFFSFRWVVRAGGALAEGNATLVEFSLAPDGDGTRLTVVETGFRDLGGPEDERRAIVDDHTDGWRRELGELAGYLAAR